MLIPFVLVLAALSHGRPIGPLPSTPQPIPTLLFPEFSDFPFPSAEQSVPIFEPSPHLEISLEPTDLPPFPYSSRPPRRISHTPTPSILLHRSARPSPTKLRRSPSPCPSRTPKKNHIGSETSSPAASTSIIPSSTPSTTFPSISTTIASPYASFETDAGVPLETVQVSDELIDASLSSEPLEFPELSLRPGEVIDASVSPEMSLPPEAQGPPPPEPIVVMTQRTPCFPASATVQLSDGSVKQMRHLSIGDRVHVGGGQYSPVHLFTHRVYDTWQVFIRLTTSSGRVLKAAGGHFVYVGDSLRPARDVRVGDRLPTAEGTWTTVTAVHQVVERGLYNPHTSVGDIVVDGIRASVYTEAVKPSIAHAALLPLRVVFSLFGLSTQCVDNGYPEMVPQALRSMVATTT